MGTPSDDDQARPNSASLQLPPERFEDVKGPGAASDDDDDDGDADERLRVNPIWRNAGEQTRETFLD